MPVFVQYSLVVRLPACKGARSGGWRFDGQKLHTVIQMAKRGILKPLSLLNALLEYDAILAI